MASAISPGTGTAPEGTGDRWVAAAALSGVEGIEEKRALREGAAAEPHAPMAGRHISASNVVRAMAANIGSDLRNVNGDSWRD
jgi:hypothetical protein